MSPSAGTNEFSIHFTLGTIGAYLISSKGLIIRRESIDWLGEHSMNLLDLVSPIGEPSVKDQPTVFQVLM